MFGIQRGRTAEGEHEWRTDEDEKTSLNVAC